MSARKLGGGHILGSGKGLAPPDGARAPGGRVAAFSTAAVLSASPFASDGSTGSPSPSRSADQDLTANVSMGAPLRRGGLVCPICGEEMVTLLQLNRHIDDAHQELPEVQQDEVKTWFDKQVLKAKKFQPLSLINQKLRGLDVFEPNEGPSAVAGPSAPQAIDPDELITRKHWQRPTPFDVCTDPTCAKGLGPLNGSVNCRKCGRLFCEAHTMYQMRLSRAAAADPERGVWARVCETCYKSRPGYNDHRGAERDWTDFVKQVRHRRVERQLLEAARLEKRLTRLTRLLADTQDQPSKARKAAEQSVVTWESDATVPRCPFCQQDFAWSFRRHHCRLCGRVVCADPQTACSTDVSLSVSAAEKPRLHVDVRMCRDCRAAVFARRDFAASLAQRPPDQRAYETLRQFEAGIRLLMPLFQRSLQTLQTLQETPGSPPNAHAAIQEAAKIRKRLMDSFAKYNLAATRMRDLPSPSATQIRLQRAVYAAASAFLHAHMVPLKHVPRMLRRSASKAADDASVAGSEVSTAVSALEAEEKDLRERLVVLEEQRFLVQQMVDNARGSRRFEEVGALSRNAQELDAEITTLRKQVGSVEQKWQGLYANAQ